MSNGNDDWTMGALAAQDQYRPLGNDPWTGLMPGSADLPLGGVAEPQPPSPVVFKTASPLVNITQADLDRATDLALSFSGGGLSTKGIRAYHGSPYDFERFDLSKIGTGEGAQAYGHGLYFAENEGVARGYRDKLATAATVPTLDNTPQSIAALAVQRNGEDGARKSLLANMRNFGEDNSIHTQSKAALAAIDDGSYKNFAVAPGHMYEVNINADPAHFLDWDKPLSGQSEHVQSVYQNLKGGIDPAEAAAKVRSLQERMTELASDRDPVTNVMRNEQQWHRLARERDAAWEDWNTAQSGAKFYGSMHRKPPIATDVMREAGIPGIKYLDQGSRFSQALYNDNPIANEARKFIEAAGGNSEKAGELFYKSNPVERWAVPERDEIRRLIQTAGNKPTSNYVVFNPGIIDILRKYGLAGAAPVGMGALAAQDQYNTP